jgi:hypothetical protein
LRIANPIYDTIFKYLLDNEKVARLMLSALIGQEVPSLQFRPNYAVRLLGRLQSCQPFGR